MAKVEIFSDRRTVWVNAASGHNIARFSRYGIDIHVDAEAQIKTGKQCLMCKSGICDLSDWVAFRQGMLRHWSIEVADKYRPDYLRVRENKK